MISSLWDSCGLVGFLKVARESRLRLGQPGTKWSDADRADHQRDCIDLVKRKSAAAEEIAPKAKRAKAQTSCEGLASYDFAAALADTVQTVTTKPIDEFCHTDGPLPLDKIPRAIVLTMDWLQSQWRAGWFMRHKLKMSIELIMEGWRIHSKKAWSGGRASLCVQEGPFSEGPPCER